MSRVLIIESSARQQDSVSRQLTRDFIQQWQAAQFKTSGMKSGVQPWILCGDQASPESKGATAGSAAWMRTSGRATFNTSPTPVSVPPVPQPVTK